MTASQTLATLAADPARIADVQPDQVPELVGACAAIQAALLLRLHTPAAAPPQAAAGPDQLLDVAEVADRLGVSKRWVYRRADKLPFTRRLTSGALRFSERGLERYQAGKR